MNILFRTTESQQGYASKLLENMRKQNLFTRCTVILQSTDHKDEFIDEYYHVIDASYGYATNYDKICSYSEMPSISKRLLEGLLPYKGTAFNMTCRQYQMHILNYDEMESEYLKHVKFWNWILEKDEINMLYFSTLPHLPWEYILYAVAKVKKIPTIIESVDNIPGLNNVGTSIKNMGKNTSIVYQKCNKLDFDMTDEVKKFYEKAKKKSGYVYVDNKNEEREKLKKIQDKWFLDPHKIKLEHYMYYIYRILTGDEKNKRRLERKFDINRRMKYRRNKTKNWEYYNGLCDKSIDYSIPYVFFALQYFPESSIMPYGGVFENQLLSISILAEGARKAGVELWVKEHWSINDRPKMFYDELQSIKNVRLIHLDVDTNELISHAIAVSSQTGTCLKESLIKGVPILNMGYNDLNGAPGSFDIDSSDDVYQGIKKIIDTQTMRFSDEEIKRYFCAISITHPCGFLGWNELKDDKDIDKYMNSTIDIIKKFINHGMKDDFCYLIDNKYINESDIYGYDQ